MTAGVLFRCLSAAGLMLLYGAACTRPTEKPSTHWPVLEGYWEGEFMPGNNLTMVLDFTSNPSDPQRARVLLFEGANQIQDDPLSRVVVEHDSLFFLIPAKETSFRGSLVVDSSLIRGSFVFPDQSIHPVLVHRVEIPSFGGFSNRTPASRTDQIPTEITYASDLLLQDFDFLREQLEQNHPQLYRFVSRVAFDRDQTERMAQVDDEMTSISFARLVAPWLSAIGCAHTGIRISREVATALDLQKVFLPLDIRVIDNRLFVIADVSGEDLIQPGTEIYSINGKSSQTIISAMRAQLASDAHRPAYQTFQMNENFSRSYVHLVEAPNYYDVALRTPLGASQSVRLASTTFDSLQELLGNVSGPDESSSGLPFTMQMQEYDTALLRISAFWAPDVVVFDEFLRTFFARLAAEDTESLILDLRGNQGGPPIFAAHLLAYLTPTPIGYFAQTEEPAAPAALYEAIRPARDLFTGTTYVLTDGGSVSTTGHLLALIHEHGLGKLVGSEPGGSFMCNDNSLALQLPNSGLDVRIPRSTFVADVSGFDIGDPVPVDYTVRPSVEDLIDGVDRTLNFTLDLIRRESL